LNILVIGKFNTEGFGLHIAGTLEDMGHSVRRFEPGYRSGRIGGKLGHRMDQVGRVLRETTDSLPSLRARRMNSLWDIAEQAPLDLAIVIHDFLWPSEVAELKRRTGANVTLWFPDALVNFGRAFFMNAPYDGLFFKDPFIIHALGDVLTTPVYYLPECFNPTRHVLKEDNTGDLDKYRCDITTAGSQHSYRVAFFKHLAAYDVKIWGPPAPLWMKTGVVASMFQGQAVYDEDKSRAFKAAKIVINNLHYGEVWGMNVRTFEAAGIGVFQMVDWRPGLAQLFEDGKELVSFRGIGDLKEKINYWLPRDAERCEIAEAGKIRAYREHTYQLRLQMLLDTLGGGAHGFPLPKITTLGPNP
jgi:spore maturation protein CgeB